MVDLKDFIIVTSKSNKTNKLYRCYCSKCGNDRGYSRKSRGDKLCKACVKIRISEANTRRIGPNLGKKFSELSRQKMSIAKKGKEPWNKGSKGVSEATSLKMRLRKIGKSPHNKGTATRLDIKIKISCSVRQIPVEEFNGMLTSANNRDRHRIKATNLQNQCFERDNFTCQKCTKKGGALNAHHKNSFAHFPEQRFLLSNLITLCKECHKDFHVQYNYPNTEEQLKEFIGLLCVVHHKE